MTELKSVPAEAQATGPTRSYDGSGPPRHAPLRVLRWSWRTLTSMRTALILLLLLAAAAVPGSLLPQRGTSPAAVLRFERANPELASVLDRLSMFQVYSSPWFAAIYLLLLLAMTGCVLPRCRRLWRALRAVPVPAPSRLDHLECRVTGSRSDLPEELLVAATDELRKRGFRVRPPGAAGAISAEKGYTREVCNLAFHASLLLLLYGVAYGHLYGFEGRVIVVEGAGFANVRAQYDEFTGGPRVDEHALEPFALTLHDFRASFEEDEPNRGAPRDFAADVTVVDGRRERRLTIRVNRPLEVNGTKAFLTGHGYAPVFTVRDGKGDVSLRGPAVFLPRDGSFTSDGVVKVPDAAPSQLAFEGFFLPTAAVGAQGPLSTFPAALNPRVLLTAYTGDLNLGNGRPQSVYSLDKSRLRQVLVDGAPLAKALAVGETMTLPDGAGSITFDGVKQFANFQLAHDPGRGLSLVAALLLLGGLTGSLLVRQRRVFVRVDAAPGLLTVTVAGQARTRRGLPEGEVDDIARSLGIAREDKPARRGLGEPRG